MADRRGGPFLLNPRLAGEHMAYESALRQAGAWRSGLGVLPGFLLAATLALGTLFDGGLARASQNEAAVAPILVGLDADMSARAIAGGEAIRRGAILAIEEINRAGGVLGRPLRLIVRDHRANPARGIDNIDEFGQTENLVAVLGGVQTPVVLAELETIHRHGIVYLVPWAAGTPIVDNGFEPNYVFRVSVRDEHAGGFLVDAARARGFERLGLLLWRTGWGRSNEAAMTAALGKAGLKPAAVQWFNTGQADMSAEVDALVDAGADVIMLVAGPPDGLVAVRDIAALADDRRVPVISHWGITGGAFFQEAADHLAKLDLSFLQTISFFEPPFAERALRLYERYCDAFGPCQSPADIMSPVGTAHAYDLVHLLALAIAQAGTIDRPQVRAALESLGRHEGIMRDYEPAFTPDRHDALDASDFRLSRYDRGGAIVPIAD